MPIEMLRSSPNNPRKHFADEDLDDLAKSIHDKLSLIDISEPTRLLSISYAVFCLKKKRKNKKRTLKTDLT